MDLYCVIACWIILSFIELIFRSLFPVNILNLRSGPFPSLYKFTSFWIKNPRARYNIVYILFTLQY